MDMCTCTKDKEITCIVHPTTRSLKERIAELEAALDKKNRTLAYLADVTDENQRLREEVEGLRDELNCLSPNYNPEAALWKEGE